MSVEKIKQLQNTIKQSIIETFKLLWQFKWSITGYFLFYSVWIMEYLNPPATDDPILQYEYSRGAWNYVNQEVYVGSMKDSLVELFLLFFIGTSNMRNHPLLAKIIFLSPWIVMLLGSIVIICECSWGSLS